MEGHDFICNSFDNSIIRNSFLLNILFYLVRIVNKHYKSVRRQTFTLIHILSWQTKRIVGHMLGGIVRQLCGLGAAQLKADLTILPPNHPLT